MFQPNARINLIPCTHCLIINPLLCSLLICCTIMSHSSENKQAVTATAAAKPWGVCEKLFNAFQPTLRPLRRLTFRQQEATAAVRGDVSSVTRSDNSAHQIQHPKLPEPAAPQPEGKHNLKPKAQEKELPLPAPPKVELRPLNPVPQPPPPPPAKEEVQKPKKGINEKVEDYITRTKGKIRIGSTVGRVASSK